MRGARSRNSGSRYSCHASSGMVTCESDEMSLYSVTAVLRLETSGDDAVVLQLRDLVPVEPEVEEQQLGVLALLGPAADCRGLLVELDCAGGQPEVATVVLHLDEVTVRQHL